MAVKDDLDICLNISGGTVNSKKQSSKVSKDNFIKRLRENKKNKKKKEANETINNPAVGANKRIKQKSLASIVANNLKKANLADQVAKPSILKKDDSKVSAKQELKRNESTVTKERKVSFSPNKDTDSSKPLISFTKPSTENAPKSVVAKKRKVDTDDAKKSLSNIFNSGDSTNTKLLRDNSAFSNDDEKRETTSNDFKPFKKQKFNATHDSKLNESETRNYSNDSFKKFNKPRDNMDRNRNNKSDKKTTNTNQHFHNKGKISSLFGHNPAIPNIGQRFVKPVNETVFSAEKFSELGIHQFSVSNLEQNMKITTMTTVQKKAIPVILSGNDVLIRSQTGSGKTLTYALPIIESLQSIRPKLTRACGIRALIIVPTRELALQTYECLLKLIKPFTWIVPGYLVGGEKRKAEKARLRKGVTVLVATPGRLLDHMKHTEALTLNDIKCLVLDEADRMLDMGYEKDISEIVTALGNVAPRKFDFKRDDFKKDDSGYDAMQMLRQRINPQKEVEKKNDEDSNLEDEEKSVTQKEYHSGSEEDEPSDLENAKSEKTENAISEKGEEKSSEKPKRQTILLSATLTHAVEKLAGLTMQNPVFVDAAKENIEATGGNMSEINEDLVVPQSVTQSYIVTPPKLRMVTLSAYITSKCQGQGSHKILVFMATQDMIDYHTDILSSVLCKPIDEEDEDSDPLVDVEFFKLHGSMSQKERTEVFKTFRKAKSGVLLCTDVAARGLDLPKVDTVVQYTGPTSTRDYVHRIGRTARAGTSGVAVIFLTPPEVEFVRMLESRRIRIKQDDMDDVLSNLLGPLSPHNSVHGAAIALQNDFENLVLENKKYYSMACKAYTSWMRFYSSYPREMREVFNRKDLHLGHYAKSFGLRDPPQKIGGVGKTIREREDQNRPKHQNRLSNQRPDGTREKRTVMKQQQKNDRRVGSLKNVRMLNVSEYGDGLEPIKKSKKF